jgi:GT2 family glycosyltransferase
MKSIDRSEICFIVSARTKEGVNQKVAELRGLGVPFMVICAEKTDNPDVIYRAKKGKFDAINYASQFIDDSVKIVCLNDVDNRIFNFDKAVEKMICTGAGMVFCKIKVNSGPQMQFYSIMDRIRKFLPVTSSGDLMLIERSVFNRLLPIPSCKTEDNYLSFKVPELGYRVEFCDDCWVETKKTSTLSEESAYKTRTVTGIYQALSVTKTTPLIRVFYLLLPFVAPLLLLQGKRGGAWTKGIIHGFTNYLKGDKEGAFEKIGG